MAEDQVRTILAAHWEAFRDEWDYRDPTEDDFIEAIEDPYRDITLWKVAWAGDEVVGQVKSFINPDENAERGYRRGYTEYISTHRDWRNQGIAGALLAWSLQELKDRGMTEAALGVDTNNPGGAFHLYTSLGFQLQTYEAVYTKAIAEGGSAVEGVLAGRVVGGVDDLGRWPGTARLIMACTPCSIVMRLIEQPWQPPPIVR